MVEELAVGRFEATDDIQFEPISSQANDVEPIQACPVALSDGEWGDVLSGFGASAQHGAAADACVLVNPDKSANDDIVFHVNMPGELGGIGEDTPISDHAVVSDMGVGHEEIVIAY